MNLRPNLDAILKTLGGRLTPAEIAVFAGLACGWSHDTIGAREGCSPKTVSTHLSHILAKLGLMNRYEVVAFAMLNGLLHIEGSPYRVVRAEKETA